MGSGLWSASVPVESMRIILLSHDNRTATLEDGRKVDVSHQDFCSYEMFGPGHDEECLCLNYKNFSPENLSKLTDQDLAS